MKFFSATLPIAASILVGQAVASKYSAVCVFDEMKCGGSIQLREYAMAKDGVCESGMCDAVPGEDVTSFSFMPTCTDDVVKDTEAHLGGRSHVLVQFYDAEGCTGDFSTALAVAATGKCYPTSDGKSSYQVTTNETSVNWTMFAGASCMGGNGTTTSFEIASADGSMCLPGNIKAKASLEGSSSPAPSGSMVPTPSPSSGATGVAPSVVAGALAVASAAYSMLNEF